MSRDKGGNGIQEVVSSILIGSTNHLFEPQILGYPRERDR
jgi:hypothetical protein